MARNKAQMKQHTRGTETLFTRHGATVHDLKACTEKQYPSINAAKKFTRKQVDATGLTSVVVW